MFCFVLFSPEVLPYCSISTLLLFYWIISIPFGFIFIQSLTCVQLFETPRTAAQQASLSFTISWGLLNLMFIELLMSSKISSFVVSFSSCLQSFPASGSFPMSQFFASVGQSTGVSASASVLLMNIQDRFTLGWTGWISLQSKGLSKTFSNTTVQNHHFFGAQLSLWSNSHIHTWLPEKNIALTRQSFFGKAMSLLINMLSRLLIAFLPRNKCLLISWLQSHLPWFWSPRK